MTKSRVRVLILTLVFVFLYFQRAILAPFILAGTFAYILSPFVELISRKLRLPRFLSVVVVYFFFLTVVTSSLFWIFSRLLKEIQDFRGESRLLIDAVRGQLGSFPNWAQLLIFESVRSFQNVALGFPTKILPFFTGAVSQIINTILFLSATFYFLNDSHKFSRAIKKIFLEVASEKMETVYSDITRVFSLYLRGQMILVLIMSTVSFLALSILGVKFSLLLGIFTGFAEIVPIVGPVVATLVAVAVSVVDGQAVFGLSLLAEAGLITLVYFVLRQTEDVVVIPQVMGKVARAHPLLVMFAVLAGGHVGGVWGLFLAVPLLAAAKILFEYYW